MSFWENRIQPAQPELPRGDGAAYRAHMHQTSSSLIYQERVQGPQVGPRYVDGTKPLQDYATRPKRAGWEPQPGDSPESARRKLLAVARHLPEEEVEARLAAIDQATQSHEGLRANLSARHDNSGIFGSMTAQEMGSMVHGSVVRGNSMSESAIAQNGHLAASALNTPGQPSLSILDRVARKEPPPFAHRTDVSSLRSSGAADGWIGTGNG